MGDKQEHLDYWVLSSYFSHHSTIEGGMVVTDHEELYHIMLSLRSHGWTTFPDKNLLVEKSDVDFDVLCFILRLQPSSRRILRCSWPQTQKAADIVSGRRKNAQFFTERFSN